MPRVPSLLAIWFIYMLQHLRCIHARAEPGSGLPGELRDSCRNSNDCRIYAYICSRAGICECNFGYKPDVVNETCIGTIGTQCFYDSHCVVRAYCKEHRVCTCKKEYPYLADDHWHCYGEWESSALHLQIVDTKLLVSCIFVCINLYNYTFYDSLL